MSEYAYFYNSENGDRVYDADSFSNWLKKFFTTGVFEGDCQVTALGSMVVNLAPGYANIMGKVKELENQTFTLEPADGSYPRIDTIVIERNDTDRDITVKLITGQLSGNTPAPTPRVWENGVYQLIVAEIYVAAGATEVTQANITDKRSDPDVCGIVAGTVTEMDFSQFTAQFESYFEQFKASNLEEFDEWFQHMKDQLDTDAAGHLQNEIDAINAKIPSGASALNKLATEDEITEINDNLTEKVTKFSGTDSGNTYVTVDGLAYDETNKKLGLKVNGADTVIPFSGGDKFRLLNSANGAQNVTFTFFRATKNYEKLLVGISDVRVSDTVTLMKNNERFVPTIFNNYYFELTNVSEGDIFTCKGAGGGGCSIWVYENFDNLQEIMSKSMSGSGTQTITIGTFSKDYEEVILGYNCQLPNAISVPTTDSISISSPCLANTDRFPNIYINGIDIRLGQVAYTLGAQFIKIFGIKTNDVLSIKSQNAVYSGCSMSVYAE